MVNGEVAKFKCPEVLISVTYTGGQCTTTITWGMMVGLSTKLVWIVHGEPPGGASEVLIFCAMH